MPHRGTVRYIRKPDSGRGTNKQRERIIQRAIARELNKPLYDVDFYCDWSSGAFLTYGQNQARLSMASRKGWVDIFIAEPRNGYHGLFIELKKEGARPILKDGSWSRDKKLQGEIRFIERQRDKGYKAEFAIGFKGAMDIINSYLGVKPSLFDDDAEF